MRLFAPFLHRKGYLIDLSRFTEFGHHSGNSALLTDCLTRVGCWRVILFAELPAVIRCHYR